MNYRNGVNIQVDQTSNPPSVITRCGKISLWRLDFRGGYEYRLDINDGTQSPWLTLDASDLQDLLAVVQGVLPEPIGCTHGDACVCFMGEDA